jgi:hypothetical protein
LLGGAPRTGAASNPNKIAAVKNRIRAFFIF